MNLQHLQILIKSKFIVHSLFGNKGSRKYFKNNIQSDDELILDKTNPKKYGRTMVLEKSKKKIDYCSRPGGWINVGKKFFWYPKNLPYFPYPLNLASCGGVTAQEAIGRLFLKHNVLLVLGCDDVNNLRRNSFCTQKEYNYKSVPFNYDSVLVFDIQGSESFQHFMLEVVPAIADCRSFLKNNPKVEILVRRGSNFSTQKFIISALGLLNKVSEFDSKSVIFAKEFYWHEFDPGDFVCNAPLQSFYRAGQLLKASIEPKKLITILVRSNGVRQIKNLSELERVISNWSIKFGFELKVLDTDKEDFNYVYELFRSAKYIIAMHGGANYNSIFMSKTSVFIEYIPKIETESVLRFVTGSGTDYGMIVVDAEKSAQNIVVPIGETIEMLTRLERRL